MKDPISILMAAFIVGTLCVVWTATFFGMR